MNLTLNMEWLREIADHLRKVNSESQLAPIVPLFKLENRLTASSRVHGLPGECHLRAGQKKARRATDCIPAPTYTLSGSACALKISPLNKVAWMYL